MSSSSPARSYFAISLFVSRFHHLSPIGNNGYVLRWAGVNYPPLLLILTQQQQPSYKLGNFAGISVFCMENQRVYYIPPLAFPKKNSHYKKVYA